MAGFGEGVVALPSEILTVGGHAGEADKVVMGCRHAGTVAEPVYTDFDEGGPFGIAAVGVHGSAVTNLVLCLEKVGMRNVSYFTPLTGIDNQDKYYVRIDGG